MSFFKRLLRLCTSAPVVLYLSLNRLRRFFCCRSHGRHIVKLGRNLRWKCRAKTLADASDLFRGWNEQGHILLTALFISQCINLHNSKFGDAKPSQEKYIPLRTKEKSFD